MDRALAGVRHLQGQGMPDRSPDPATRQCELPKNVSSCLRKPLSPTVPGDTRATSEPSWRARLCSSGGAVLYAARLNIGAVAADIAPWTIRNSDAFSVAQLPKRSLATVHGSG